MRPKHTLSSALTYVVEHGLQHDVSMVERVVEEGDKVIQLRLYRFSNMR